MNLPMTFQDTQLSEYFSLQPNDVKARATTDTEFNKRYLYFKVFSVFKFKLPANWDLAYFRYWLFHHGTIGALYTKEYGWICSPYGVDKLGMYHKPAVISVKNQFLKDVKKGVIGVNAEIIKILDDRFGLDDLVTRYAVQLALIDKSFNTNLLNCNTSAFFEADNKKQAEEIKLAYAEAQEGKPFVVVNAGVTKGKQITTLFESPAQKFMGDKLLQARRTVVNEFLTEIGIKNANYDKRERLNSQEVNRNNDETSAIVSVMFENLKECCERCKKIGLDIDVEMRYNYQEEESNEDFA